MTSTYGHDDETPYEFIQTLVVEDLFKDDEGLPRQWTKDDYFATIPRSMFTMLQVATLDKWSTHIARPIMKYDGTVLIWLFLFIGLARYGVLNVAIGTIAEATGRNVKKQMNTVNEIVAEAEFNVVAALEKGVRKISEEDGRLNRERLMTHLARPSVVRQFKCVNISVDHAKELFDSCAIVETDMDHCSTQRYCEGIVELKGDARSLQCLKLLKLTQATELC